MLVIEGLTKEPPEGDIKQMKGYKDSTCRLRIGKYRIIYRYIQDTLCVEDINSRGDIYK
ncbi:MAG: type II toxin-antitoxin system RelE/ParE family toxin [Eubacterium sp.]